MPAFYMLERSNTYLLSVREYTSQLHRVNYYFHPFTTLKYNIKLGTQPNLYGSNQGKHKVEGRF